MLRQSRHFPLRELRERIAYAHSKGIEMPVRVVNRCFDGHYAMQWMLALPKAPVRWRYFL